MNHHQRIQAHLEVATNWSAPAEILKAPPIGSCDVANAYIDGLYKYRDYCMAAQEEAYAEYNRLFDLKDALCKVQYQIVLEWNKHAKVLDKMASDYLDSYNAAPAEVEIEEVVVSCLHPCLQWRLYGMVLVVGALVVAHFVGGF
jgi:hypothetical protein